MITWLSVLAFVSLLILAVVFDLYVSPRAFSRTARILRQARLRHHAFIAFGLAVVLNTALGWGTAQLSPVPVATSLQVVQVADPQNTDASATDDAWALLSSMLVPPASANGTTTTNAVAFTDNGARHVGIQLMTFGVVWVLFAAIVLNVLPVLALYGRAAFRHTVSSSPEWPFPPQALLLVFPWIATCVPSLYSFLLLSCLFMAVLVIVLGSVSMRGGTLSKCLLLVGAVSPLVVRAIVWSVLGHPNIESEHLVFMVISFVHLEGCVMLVSSAGAQIPVSSEPTPSDRTSIRGSARSSDARVSYE